MTKIGTAVSIILCWLWLALAAMPVAAQPSDTQRRWETLNTEIIQAYRSGDFAKGSVRLSRHWRWPMRPSARAIPTRCRA